MLVVWIAFVFLAAGAHALFNPYQVLGVQRTATSSEVKKQFRRLSRENHPDVATTNDAKERYADILRAYSVLSDPKKRAQFDQDGVLDDDRQGRPAGSQFNNFFQQRRQRMRPIESSTRSLTLADFVIDFRGYRGHKIRLLQVFFDQSPESHQFAPAWEALSKTSAIRHQVDFARLDWSDQHLVELSELSVSQLPAVFVFVNGEAYPVRELRLANAIGPMVFAVEKAVQAYFTDAVASLKKTTIESVVDLRQLVSRQRFHKPLVLVNGDDPLFNQVAGSLISLMDSIDVVATTTAVLSTVSKSCPPARFRTTSVWVYHSHAEDLCGASRFPSGRLDDEDGIMRFVTKRLEKPMPTLTNHTMAALCIDGTPCLVDVRTNANRDLPPLSDAVPGAIHGFRFASADATLAPAMAPFAAHPTSVFSGSYNVVVLSERGYVSFAGGPEDVHRFVGDVAAGRRQPAMLPAGWALDAGPFPYSPWRRLMQYVDAAYDLPFANVAFLAFIWFVLSRCRTVPPRTNDQRGAPPQPQSPGASARSEPRAQSPYEAGRGASSPRPPPAAGSEEPRRRSASTEHESPTGVSPDAQRSTRTYPGPGGSHETTRRSIRGLSSADIAECAGAGRVLLVLLFAAGDGVKAPADCARLLEYPDVRVRAVPRKMPRWWDWVKSHAPDALRDSERDKTPLIVAVRVKRGVAAIKPLARPMTMWVDGLMEGAEPIAIPADAATLSAAVN